MRRLAMTLMLTMLSLSPAHGQEPTRKATLADVSARKAAERARMRAANAARERAAAKAQAVAMAKAEAQYKAMLPYLLIQQRTEMERLSALERNISLQRMAAASEAQVRAERERTATLQWYLMNNRPR